MLAGRLRLSFSLSFLLGYKWCCSLILLPQCMLSDYELLSLAALPTDLFSSFYTFILLIFLSFILLAVFLSFCFFFPPQSSKYLRWTPSKDQCRLSFSSIVHIFTQHTFFFAFRCCCIFQGKYVRPSAREGKRKKESCCSERKDEIMFETTRTHFLALHYLHIFFAFAVLEPKGSLKYAPFHV